MKSGMDFACFCCALLRVDTRGGKQNTYMFHAFFATPFETGFRFISALVHASVRHTFRYVVPPRLHTTSFPFSTAKML